MKRKIKLIKQLCLHNAGTWFMKHGWFF